MITLLVAIGFLVQEQYHPLHANVGGLAVTHMDQLRDLPLSQGLLSPFMALLDTLPEPFSKIIDVGSLSGFDFGLVLFLLFSVETFALKRLIWTLIVIFVSSFKARFYVML